MKKINLCLGIHNHQPVGNFDHVMEHACERSYLPFLQMLEKHPRIKMSVHFTGYLLEWINTQYKEVIHSLERLVASGQVELITGGYYEPILATIPDTDKLGQINKLSSYLRQLFSRDSVYQNLAGMWLAERVWEPHLPKMLAMAGVRYVCVDDSHFKGVGMPQEQLYRSYMTEEQGHKLEIFPINEKLRYLIPFDSPENVIQYLGSIATEDGARGAFYFDDGEKFGVWPGTYETVFTKGWLDKFFTLLEENSHWINFMTFGDYARQIDPAGRVYLPTASYSEMMEWSLPPDRSQLLQEATHNVDPKYASFLRGGFWRNFLVKYPESNNLHKKMLHVHHRLVNLTDIGSIVAELPDGDKLLSEAQNKLWMGQSNDPFWHGVFGGLYLTNLRTANYQALVEAESILDQLRPEYQKHTSWIEVETTDFDADGQDDILVRNPYCNYYFTPSYGGSLFELDYKLKPYNVIDTLARRPEPYHSKLKDAHATAGGDGHSNGQKSKEANLDEYLSYDWHRRLCFMDHFLGEDTTLDTISKTRYAELGDFVDQPYAVNVVSADKETVTIALERHGHIWTGELRQKLQLQKTYKISSSSSNMVVSYKITNSNDGPISLWFAPECNFNFLAPEASDRYFFTRDGDARVLRSNLSSQLAIDHASSIGIADEWLGIKLILSVSEPTTIWRYPVYTVSNSEAGYERIYQGSAVLPNWRLNLSPGESFKVNLQLGIFSIDESRHSFTNTELLKAMS
jgi:alpha-amylase